MPLPAGRRRDRVRFERRPIAQDGYGNTKGSDWVVLIESRRVELLPTKGGEQIIAGRLQGVAAFDLRIPLDRAVAEVTTDDRVVDARDPKRTFAIRFIGDLEGRRGWLLMQLEQGVAE